MRYYKLILRIKHLEELQISLKKVVVCLCFIFAVKQTANSPSVWPYFVFVFQYASTLKTIGVEGVRMDTRWCIFLFIFYSYFLYFIFWQHICNLQSESYKQETGTELLKTCFHMQAFGTNQIPGLIQVCEWTLVPAVHMQYHIGRLQLPQELMFYFWF